jgi:hypothetical protein
MVAEVVYSIPGPPTRGGCLLTFSRDPRGDTFAIDKNVDQVPARYKRPAAGKLAS